jgi:hypothetical protein
MKKLPLYLRLGFAIMGVDPYAKPPETPDKPPAKRGTDTPTSQTAQWLPTKQIQPPLYRKVIIYTKDNEILYNWARTNNSDYIHSTDDRTINNVTHWMEIQSPTKSKITTNDTEPTDIIKPKLPI